SGWIRIARPAPLAALFDDPLAAIADLELDVHGSTDAELLNPFLAGGVASGPIELDLDLTGPARAPRGRLRLAGPQVRVYFPRPYPTRIEAVEIELRASEGELVVERAEAGLNRGTIRLGGGLDRTRGLALTCRLDGVRYRLDYGLTVQIAGELALERPPGGTGRLSGELVVDRGMLRRDLDLDRELIAALLGPPDLSGTEAGPLDALQLDLQVTTREGVWVANNLADLHVDWNLLRLRGTVANPVLQGRLDADPGGLVTAFGQTVRVDRGALTLSGDPTVEPRLDLEVTTSFDDPTLGRKERWATPAGWGDRGEWATGTFGAGSGWEGWYESLASGLGQHYTERFLTRLSGGLVSTSVGFEPLPIFGETDGEARLTIEQRLSPYLSYLLSINVREGEARTDLVEISGLRSLPGLTAQMFSNDAGNPGATLAQTLHLGGREPDSDDPRLRRLLFADPEALPPGRLLRYRLRRAAGFRRGDTIPAGAEFDVEMDVAEQLRREGYPGALVEVTRKKVSESRVDLRLDVEAGPKVEVAFDGAELPRAIRRRIAGLYQPERLAEAASLAEMREETARALHAQGYLEAEVGVGVEPPDPKRPGVRTLRVECRVGERVEPDEPVFRGVDAEIADALEVSFSSRLARIELALGTPGAEAEVRRVLRRFGYPEATVAGRRLEAEGQRLTVSVEPGPLARIGAVELAGVPPDEVERLRDLVPLEAGSPLRGDQVTQAVALLEEDFRGRGHADARVEVGIEPDPQDPWRATVRLEVRPGPSYRLSGVDFEGLRSTDPDWAADVAALEEGAQVSDEQLAEARRRLYGTRVFRGIRSRREPLGEPTAGAGTVDTRAVFEVEEIARYAVSFGGRWESEEGLGGVVYAADRNFLGKGRTLGVQAIHAGEERRSLGLFHAWPRFLRPNLLLELFVEGSQELENDQELSRTDSWVQLTFPLGDRTRSRVYLDREDRRFGALPGDGAATGAETEPGRLVDTFLGWQLIHDTRQRTLGASDERLLFLGLDVSGSHEALGSDTTSIRLFGQIKAYVPFGRERSASTRPLWAQSLRAGWIETTGGELAPVDRLRAGGEYSVRGYPTESLGPLDDEGRPLGGEIFLVLNEELQVPLWREVLGVVFFDAGNVWASRRDLDWRLATSAGVGLRSPSPIGPLRLDLAFPLDRREGIDPEYKVYFGFGPTF
ncbi:MAG TPA: translocation/assembly module TamB domain-containing protein, partial [Thermoanaerobaculia bacterium]|nr:translocation/assembly module TamB domain-containing protein [Thermoanaerobaculia bacterium]